MASAASPQSIPDCVSPAHLRRLRGRAQAAAVCYRVSGRGIEFLLVRTRGGRWTFPKGGIEPGLTHAQSAALEAYEEAGVHGRIEITSFARYVRRAQFKREEKSVLVLAFLCEVLRLAKPQEPKRKRTWFSAEKAKRRLREGRAPACADELASVVDRAVARVRRLHGGEEARPRGGSRDPLHRVHFEAAHAALQATKVPTALRAYFPGPIQPFLSAEATPGPYLLRLLPGCAEAIRRPLLQLGNGTEPPASLAGGVLPAVRQAKIRNERRAKRKLKLIPTDDRPDSPRPR